MRANPKQAEAYREAYEGWQEQLLALHHVVLEGALLEPPKLKGLLNREARAKESYDAARLALLVLDTAIADDDPFAKVS